MTLHTIGAGVARLMVEGKTYLLPKGVMRVAVERLIELAPCALAKSQHLRAETVEVRSAEALAFLARLLRAETDEAMAEVVDDEVKRSGGGESGALEVYANLCTLGEWMATFYGDLLSRFACAEHRDIGRAQTSIAEAYLGQNTEGEGGEEEPSPHARPERAPDDPFSRAEGAFRAAFTSKRHLDH